MVLDTLEAILGGFLILAAPGLAWSRALFPEWRIAGPQAYLRAVETASMAVVVSLSLTIVVGFGLTFNTNGSFPASWSDPLLEAILAAIAVVGAVLAWARGGFSRVPPPAPALEPAPGADSPEELLRDLARLQAESRRLRHALRRGGISENQAASVRGQLAETDRSIEELKSRREEAFRG